jgi:hypothetical protein
MFFSQFCLFPEERYHLQRDKNSLLFLHQRTRPIVCFIFQHIHFVSLHAKRVGFRNLVSVRLNVQRM